MDGHGFDHDKTRAALGVTDIAVGDVLIDEAVFARQPRHHRLYHHAIGDAHPGDVQRFEQFHGAGSSSRYANDLAGSDFAQLTAKNLSGGTDRKLFHECEPLRPFEFRDIATQQEVLDLVQIDRLTIHRDHERAGPLAERCIRHRHHADVLDLGMAQNIVLDFLATDLFAAALDD